jgi:uncharacterized protein YdaL
MDTCAENIKTFLNIKENKDSFDISCCEKYTEKDAIFNLCETAKKEKNKDIFSDLNSFIISQKYNQAYIFTIISIVLLVIICLFIILLVI